MLCLTYINSVLGDSLSQPICSCQGSIIFSGPWREKVLEHHYSQANVTDSTMHPNLLAIIIGRSPPFAIYKPFLFILVLINNEWKLVNHGAVIFKYYENANNKVSQAAAPRSYQLVRCSIKQPVRSSSKLVMLMSCSTWGR